MSGLLSKVFGGRSKVNEEEVSPPATTANTTDEKGFEDDEKNGLPGPGPDDAMQFPQTAAVDEEIVDVDATPQEGVRAAQAALAVWTKPHLIIAYIL